MYQWGLVSEFYLEYETSRCEVFLIYGYFYGKINSKLNVVDYPVGSFVKGNIDGNPEIQIVNVRPFSVPIVEDGIIYIRR